MWGNFHSPQRAECWHIFYDILYFLLSERAGFLLKKKKKEIHRISVLSVIFVLERASRSLSKRAFFPLQRFILIELAEPCQGEQNFCKLTIPVKCQIICCKFLVLFYPGPVKERKDFESRTISIWRQKKDITIAVFWELVFSDPRSLSLR